MPQNVNFVCVVQNRFDLEAGPFFELVQRGVDVKAVQQCHQCLHDKTPNGTRSTTHESSPVIFGQFAVETISRVTDVFRGVLQRLSIVDSTRIALCFHYDLIRETEIFPEDFYDLLRRCYYTICLPTRRGLMALSSRKSWHLSVRK